MRWFLLCLILSFSVSAQQDTEVRRLQELSIHRGRLQEVLRREIPIPVELPPIRLFRNVANERAMMWNVLELSYVVKHSGRPLTVLIFRSCRLNVGYWFGDGVLYHCLSRGVWDDDYQYIDRSDIKRLMMGLKIYLDDVGMFDRAKIFAQEHYERIVGQLRGNIRDSPNPMGDE
ncbi:MAG: hypothetical protein ACYTEU_06150 [Planctomycetota bacterium]